MRAESGNSAWIGSLFKNARTRLHGDHEEEPEEEHEHDPEDPEAGVACESDEQREEAGRQEADGPAGRCVEAEKLALATGRGDPGEEPAACRLNGTDEKTQEQSARPEPALGVADEQNDRACDHETG